METVKRSKYDVPHPKECPECAGTGVSPETAGSGYMDKQSKRYVTENLGSGCPRCFGVGRTP